MENRMSQNQNPQHQQGGQPKPGQQQGGGQQKPGQQTQNPGQQGGIKAARAGSVAASRAAVSRAASANLICIEGCETPPHGGVFVFGLQSSWSRLGIHASAAVTMLT